MERGKVPSRLGCGMPADPPRVEPDTVVWSDRDGQAPSRRVLVIEDEQSIVGVLRRILALKGFEVLVAENGQKGLEMALSERPDLILLDVMMPGMNGFEVCRGLREDVETAMIPVIMLTVKSRTEDRIRGMECGADDYVTKPFDADELLVRVEAVLRRRERDLYASPLTGLPGNISIEAELKRRIGRGEPFAVISLDIDHFKAYNDEYGYHKGDDVISIVSMLITRVVRERGNRGDFVGHIGGDDFVVITRPETVDAIADHVIEMFDRAMPEHYSPEARNRGYIKGVDRHGRVERFPLMTLSVVATTNEWQPIEHPAKVAEILADLKKAAKAHSGSVYLRDRRKSASPAHHLPIETQPE